MHRQERTKHDSNNRKVDTGTVQKKKKRNTRRTHGNWQHRLTTARQPLVCHSRRVIVCACVSMNPFEY